MLNYDTKLLHITESIISNSLTHLFNLSLATGFVPLDWKLARVTPAYKDKGDLQDKTNYIPLSMVLHLANMFERQVQTQLTGYLSKHEFISIDQSAYIKHQSTQTSLHRLIDGILENMNNREITGLCLLDIRKCFDTIDHVILLQKMHNYGIRDCEFKWFESYLYNRNQMLCYDGKTSNAQTITIGVPQGTVLGPILFLLFVNDLSNVVKDTSINVYADDVVIYASHADIDQVRTHLQAAINEVAKWYSTNVLQLSAEKCVSMVIHHNRLAQLPDLLINLNSRILKQVHEVKYLDDRLKWDKPLMSVSRKLAMHNANLRRIRKFVPQNILIQTYKSTVEPIMNSGCTDWGYASANVSNVIHRLENKSARAVTGNYDYINVRVDGIFNGLRLTRFQSRRDYLFHFSADVQSGPRYNTALYLQYDYFYI